MRPHLGVDYAAPVGHAGARRPRDGVVTLAGWYGGYGKAVRIRHPNGYETLYGHLSRINVQAGPARRRRARSSARWARPGSPPAPTSTTG